ncbi:MAG TPA: DUF1648 domain-containing protein [Opitutaceae bacterium]|nr:DUF1648 domain-containing protein [Opitutaceae bacterium]
MKTSRIALGALVLSSAFLVAYVLWLGPALPPRVASHFSLGGRADGWSSRSRYDALYLGIAGLAEVLLVGLGFALPYLPADSLHAPRQDYWRSPEHYPQACAHVRNFLCWLGALTSLWFAALHRLMANANRLNPPRLHDGALGAVLVVYLGTVFLLVSRLIRRFERLPA